MSFSQAGALSCGHALENGDLHAQHAPHRAHDTPFVGRASSPGAEFRAEVFDRAQPRLGDASPRCPGGRETFLVEANFYRSAQPAPEGFKALVARKGLRTVVNLRATHSDDALTQGLGLRLFHFGMPAWHIEREDVAAALRTLRSETRAGPTLLHCTLGADRTGLVAALYRTLYHGWSKQEALAEMEHGNFGFHDIWINIPHFIDQIDLDQLKRDVAVP